MTLACDHGGGAERCSHRCHTGVSSYRSTERCCTGASVAVDVRKIVQMYGQCNFDQFQRKLWKGAIL